MVQKTEYFVCFLINYRDSQFYLYQLHMWRVLAKKPILFQHAKLRMQRYQQKVKRLPSHHTK